MIYKVFNSELKPLHDLMLRLYDTRNKDNPREGILHFEGEMLSDGSGHMLTVYSGFTEPLIIPVDGQLVYGEYCELADWSELGEGKPGTIEVKTYNTSDAT